MKLKTNKFEITGIVLVVIFTIIMCLDRINVCADDVYISLRYVQNILNGNGSVFNPGERIEAVSNLSWVWLISGICYLLNISDSFVIIYVAKATGVLLHLAASVLLYITLKKMFKDYIIPLILVLFFSINPFAALQAIQGLENPLINFIMIAILYSLIQFEESGKKKYLTFSAILVGSLSVSRPEGIIYIFSFIVYLYHRFRIVEKNKPDIKILFRNTLIPVILFGIFIVWRSQYYGDILPNTAYAKNSPGIPTFLSGIRYTLDFLCYFAAPLFLPVILFMPPKQRFEIFKHNSFNIFLASVIILQIMFVVYAGGDGIAAFRFYVILIPVLILLNSEIISGFINEPIIFRKNIIISMLLCLIIITYLDRDNIRARHTEESGLSFRNWSFINPSYLDIGMKLKEISGKGETALIGEAGLIPFINPQLNFFDVYGLIDRHIAKEVEGRHMERLDPEYFMNKTFDYFIVITPNECLINNIAEKGIGGSYQKSTTEFIPIDQVIYHNDFAKKYKLIYHTRNGMIFKKLKY